MKLPREMTLLEIEYLFHVHQFPAEAERDRCAKALKEIIGTIEFIEERIAQTPTLPCPCEYCNEIRNAKVKPPKAAKIKEPPINFTLD